MSKYITVRFPDQDAEALEELAKEDRRSLASVVRVLTQDRMDQLGFRKKGELTHVQH